MGVRSQSGEKKSEFGVNERLGVEEFAVSTSSAKSICILLPLPQPPAATSAEITDAELAAFGRALTSVLKNIGTVKYGPVAVVTPDASLPTVTAPSSPALAISDPPSPVSGSPAFGPTPHAIVLRTIPNIAVIRIEAGEHA